MSSQESPETKAPVPPSLAERADVAARIAAATAGAPDRFCPVDRPRPALPHIAAYRRQPRCIAVIAWLEMLTAAFVLVSIWIAAPSSGDSLTTPIVATAGSVLLLAAGAGLREARGWGWWCSCALFYYMLIGVVGIAIRSVMGLPAAPPLGLAAIALPSVIVLVLLNQSAVMQHIHFGTGMAATSAMRVSPATTGFGLALIQIGLQLVF